MNIHQASALDQLVTGNGSFITLQRSLITKISRLQNGIPFVCCVDVLF